MVPDGRDGQTFAIIGAAMEVHNQLGCGFLENVYQEALAVELLLRGIPFERELSLPVLYKGRPLNCSYRADFVIAGEIIVELKALDKLTTIEEAQVINYLKATGLQRALLINFGTSRLEHKRYVREYLRSSASSADRVLEVLGDEDCSWQ
jgi:GxxExxY protein